jgi:hypothetical protein
MMLEVNKEGGRRHISHMGMKIKDSCMNADRWGYICVAR